jgi:hypothetical protein
MRLQSYSFGVYSIVTEDGINFKETIYRFVGNELSKTKEDINFTDNAPAVFYSQMFNKP